MKPDAIISEQHCECCAHTAAPISETPLPANATRVRIPTMDCAVEESEIRRALEPVDGIHSLSFQLGTRTLGIKASAEALPKALEAIRKAGFKPQQFDAADDEHDKHVEHGFASGSARFGLALLLAIAAESVEFFAPHTTTFTVIGMALALVAIVLSGFETYLKGFAALRHGRLTITGLMSVAVTGAFLIGQWPEAAMVMALYAIAELIEARSVDRARNAIKTLMALAPDKTNVQQPDGSWQEMRVEQVALGSIVRVRPGERIPMDGTVTQGASAVNQAPVTGESIPVDKEIGDPVFAGTVNETGEIEVKVTAEASNSTLACIIHAVEQAQGTRAPMQRFIDNFSRIYTPAIFGLAILVTVLLPLLTDATWMQALYKGLVLLVIGCPCALVIATPVTVVSALAAAARRGILIKGGVFLEGARKLKVIALDKTGTITEGKPVLVQWESLQGDSETNARIAASLAGRSDHPVSKAIAAGLPQTRLDVAAFSALAGRGTQGTVEGSNYALANYRLVTERGFDTTELKAKLDAQLQQGRTVTLLLTDDAVLAMFAVADTIKPGSRAAIAELTALGVTPVMLTGDNEVTAASIAKEAGIAEAKGNLLPEDKLTVVESLQITHGPAAMTGDGINDAPALAKADIGIAMGGAGTDTAMEAADIVIMNDDLRRIPEAIRLSRHTHTVLWQNIAIALGIKAVFFVLAVFGSATMWMAVFADMGASLIVVGNGLRLLRR